jgi:hypothetical protein
VLQVYDLEEMELCYSPQFGAAKDPVNMAGMISSNHLRGDSPVVDWETELEVNLHPFSSLPHPHNFPNRHLLVCALTALQLKDRWLAALGLLLHESDL